MITSTGNSRIRELVRLKKSAKDRNQKGVFLVEGPKMFREIPAQLLQEVYISESFSKTGSGSLAGSGSGSGRFTAAGSGRLSETGSGRLSAAGSRRLSETGSGRFSEAGSKQGSGSKPSGADGVPAEVVSDSVFQHLSDTRTPQGILAVVQQLHYEIDDLFGNQGKPSLVIVLENVQDPGNLGTIIRTAEAAGVTGILMSSGCADIYNPKVTRSTMGSIFRVPFVYTQDLHASLEHLKIKGVQLFAAHLKGSTGLYDQSYTGPSAFLIGNESKGLTAETVALADQAVRIDMSGEVESLNAAIASAIMMFEARRQRTSC